MSIATVVVMLCAATLLSAQAPPSTLTPALARDQEVLSAVLDDLATHRGDDSPIDGAFTPDPLTLAPKPHRYEITASDVSEMYSSKPWSGLARAERPRFKEAIRDLARRMKEPLVRFTTGSALVGLYTGADPKTLSPFQFRQAPIESSRPGYSKDRHTAIVSLSIPWSIHGCSAVYLVMRKDGVWSVQVRDFECYL